MLRRLWNHRAIEHFIGDRRRNPLDERSTHLRITTENSNGSLNIDILS
jgi:hypothetical protein